jgi:glycosyltransferase involved in cell wall biosynthesis
MISNARNKIRIAVVQNIVVPYEIPLLSRLATLPEIEMKVFFCAENYRGRKWRIRHDFTFDYEILPGLTVEAAGFESSFNPTIITRLIKYHPDVIVLSGGTYGNPTMMMGFLTGILRKIPIIYRSDEEENARDASSFVAKILSVVVERAIIKHSRAIICPGDKARIYNLQRGATDDKIFISPYTTTDDTRFVERSEYYRLIKESIKDEFKIREEKLILFVGQLEKGKGLLYLLEAFRAVHELMNNVGLIILGEGSLKNELMNLCRQEGLNAIYFPGFVDGENKIKFYSISDIFILPSLVDLWGIVVNEAMLCALPVIISRAAGASEMVIDGLNGFIVKEGDSKELTNAILKLTNRTGLASAMGAESLKIVQEKYNLDNRLKGFLSAIYQAQDQLVK